MLVGSISVLLARLGSVVGLLTVAWLKVFAAAVSATLTRILKVVTPPFAKSLGLAQVILRVPAPIQVQPTIVPD